MDPLELEKHSLPRYAWVVTRYIILVCFESIEKITGLLK